MVDKQKETMLFSEIQDPLDYSPFRLEDRAKLVRELEDSYNRSQRILAGAIGAVVGFILGYIAWAIWPLNRLIYRLFNECFL